jgi:hypothetical protein
MLCTPFLVMQPGRVSSTMQAFFQPAQTDTVALPHDGQKRWRLFQSIKLRASDTTPDSGRERREMPARRSTKAAWREAPTDSIAAALRSGRFVASTAKYGVPSGLWDFSGREASSPSSKPKKTRAGFLSSASNETAFAVNGHYTKTRATDREVESPQGFGRLLRGDRIARGQSPPTQARRPCRPRKPTGTAATDYPGRGSGPPRSLPAHSERRCPAGARTPGSTRWRRGSAHASLAWSTSYPDGHSRLVWR